MRVQLDMDGLGAAASDRTMTDSEHSDRPQPSGPLPIPPGSAAVLRESDAQLVARARSGDKTAFAGLVRRHQARIHRLIVHVVHDAAVAEELVQEVFVRAYRALAGFDDRSQPFTWLYRIALNLALNEKRRASNRPLDEHDARLGALLRPHSAEHEDPAQRALQREIYTALAQGIDQLSDTLRTTLLLVGVEGLTFDETADVLGIPSGTVAWRIHEARKRLLAHLESRGLVPDRLAAAAVAHTTKSTRGETR